MRDIKFRAWSGKQGAFIQEAFSVLADGSGIRITIPVDDDVVQDVNAEFYFQDNDNLAVQQFTGLKDKNGVEIYEGDLVEFKLGGEKVIGAVSYMDSQARWVKTFTPSYGAGEKDLSSYASSHEVVGNIYESPELLEAKS